MHTRTYIHTNDCMDFPLLKIPKKTLLITYAALEYRYMLLHLSEATVKLYEINL